MEKSNNSTTTVSGSHLSTELLDYQHPSLQRLIAERGWNGLSEYERIGAIYDFVRNDIAFGYNVTDDLPASQVLADGLGQCNTKATLLMALLRATGISCRFHGFTINKRLQKGAITGLGYLLAPRSIIHSWVEVSYQGRWVNLEGFILDQDYLSALQQQFPGARPFCGYGVAVRNLAAPPVSWRGTDTYIQSEGINQDLGVYENPDDFYRVHGTNVSGWKKWFFINVIRHQMNRNVVRMRSKLKRPASVLTQDSKGSVQGFGQAR
ncbi:MAG: transglutaminase [Curvibacter sp. GWA2_64_110]|nr:MAG: transglutaminase [Curvibacter sp. GWA2_64_110]HCY14595.1 transglutaminase [Curvibacter sp.]